MTPRRRTIRCVLDIEVGSEPIHGVLSTDGAPGTSFLGWLELVTTLDRTRRPDGHREDPADGPHTEE